MTDYLLVELLTEELPSKRQKAIGEAFGLNVFDELKARSWLNQDASYQWFITPRRIAVVVSGVGHSKPPRYKLMPVSVGLDAFGNPTEPLLKKLQSKNLSMSAINSLERDVENRVEYLFYSEPSVAGLSPGPIMHVVVESAARRLPVSKVMRWGDSFQEFVRPIRNIVLMFNEDVVFPASSVLEFHAGPLPGISNLTKGHRFLCGTMVRIPHAEQYEETLERFGFVIPSFSKRRESIERQLHHASGDLRVAADDALLDEVTSLVEYPAVYAGEFDARFLSVPSEVLILSMKQHQKYFPLLDAAGRLAPRFLFVSNIATDDPSHIIAGNERVLRARLSDAAFFFEQDKKTPLADRVEKLAHVVYHNKLGTQLQRVERIQALAVFIANKMSINAEAVRQAAYLCKADLVTDMVGEFPELQGAMGYYYALHDGVSEDVALAIKEHYQPRFSGDATPSSLTGLCVALADKLDTLVGMFGIGVVPTGDKDPFALRRQALGVVKLLEEAQGADLSVDLTPIALPLLIERAIQGFSIPLARDTAANVRAFILERLRNELNTVYPANVVQAVFELDLDVIPDIYARVAAVRDFTAMPEAEALAAANKRIKNILRKADVVQAAPVESALFQEDAERALFAGLEALMPIVEAHSAHRRYTEALHALASIRPQVDAFFDQVMVMADDVALRHNRLALLRQLNAVMNQVADISRLAV